MAGQLSLLPNGPDVSLTCMDCIDWLRGMPAGSADLVVTDPAYESLEKHRAKGTTTRLKHSKSSSNDWFPIFANVRFPELFSEIYRALARNAHLYMFCDHETLRIAIPIAEAAGFKFWKPLVWDKKAIGMGYHYRGRYEFIAFFEKGKRKLRDLGRSDIIECKRVVGGYPTEKPVAASEVLIHQSSETGERVIDPFVGSGSSGEAALRLNRRFSGCDVQPGAIVDAEKRLLKVRLALAEGVQ
jgi:site-specific DNA-methyltransferase (adenine-specific)